MSKFDERPIGVFDSGVGGLSVLKAMRARLPAEDFIYLGDTARLPYGTKSAATVLSYAHRAAAFLQRNDIKLLVVACNTASAVALPDLANELLPLPVEGVVEPGARAAVTAVPAGHHLVLATEGTVRLHAYRKAIAAMDTKATVDELPCELLVALAEEGWTSDSITLAVIRRYLAPWFDQDGGFEPQSLILGCTHFPLLRDAVQSVVGAEVSVVDSAATTASLVDERLSALEIANDPGNTGSLRLLATDGVHRFARVGSAFLGTELAIGDIELTDL